MDEREIFMAGLGICSPWKIIKVELLGDELAKELHIYIEHEKGARFEYEGASYSVYDHQDRTWHHLRFFQHSCFLHVRVPRVKINSGEVRLISVPWAAPGSSFTLLFELNVLDLVMSGMSMRGVSKRLGIGDKRVARIISRHVSEALAQQDIKIVKELSVDETSTRKGHNYFTIMCDRKEKKVVGIGLGKDQKAFAEALLEMEVRGGCRKSVRTITMDMSRSYIAAASEKMSQASIVFDRFHIMKKLNEAVDEIRRQDQKEYIDLKKTRYLWLKNNENLNEQQRVQVAQLENAYPNIGKAYRLKEIFRCVLNDAHYSHYLKPLKDWMTHAWDSELEPIQKFVNTLRRHWYGIKSYFKKQATNAFAERVNLRIQEIKRIAKGYRNMSNFMTMIYFHLGGLEFQTH